MLLCKVPAHEPNANVITCPARQHGRHQRRASLGYWTAPRLAPAYDPAAGAYTIPAGMCLRATAAPPRPSPVSTSAYALALAPWPPGVGLLPPPPPAAVPPVLPSSRL